MNKGPAPQRKITAREVIGEGLAELGFDFIAELLPPIAILLFLAICLVAAFVQVGSRFFPNDSI